MLTSDKTLSIQNYLKVKRSFSWLDRYLELIVQQDGMNVIWKMTKVTGRLISVLEKHSCSVCIQRELNIHGLVCNMELTMLVSITLLNCSWLLILKWSLWVEGESLDFILLLPVGCVFKSPWNLDFFYQLPWQTITQFSPLTWWNIVTWRIRQSGGSETHLKLEVLG